MLLFRIVNINYIGEAAFDLLLDFILFLALVGLDFLLALPFLLGVRVPQTPFRLADELFDVSKADFRGELRTLEHLIGLARGHPCRRVQNFFVADIRDRTFRPKKSLAISRSDYSRTFLLNSYRFRRR